MAATGMVGGIGQVLVKPIEAVLDERATLGDPALGGLEAPRVEAAGSGAAELV